MRVLVLHDAVNVNESPLPDEADGLVQVVAVSEALRELGHEGIPAEFTGDLSALRRKMARHRPDVVFNLVESVLGQGRLIHLAPAMLESLGVPFTGSSSEAMVATSNKVLAKRVLRGAGLPTPLWRTCADLRRQVRVPPGRYIIKSVWEHGSRGLDASSVIEADDAAGLLAAIGARRAALGGEAFAERFVAGREFNVSMLRGEILAVAEIMFEPVWAERACVVGYAAKWQPESSAWKGTRRRLSFSAADHALLTRVRACALGCWKVFAMRGYARVDMRVDERGWVWIVDVNANPCLSPDAGFAAAIEHAGMSYAQAIAGILDDVA